jgi:hypothetical protein
MDGSPVYPVNWEPFDNSPYSYGDHYDFPLIVDPANPNSNLLTGMTQEKRQDIRVEASRAITYLREENYLPVFDPRNVTQALAA